MPDTERAELRPCDRRIKSGGGGPSSGVVGVRVHGAADVTGLPRGFVRGGLGLVE
jgi:hypothetical protein